MAVKKLPVSFKENEQYIRDYITSKLNYSAYIKELVLNDMNRNNSNKPKSENEKNKSFENGGFDF